MSTSKKEIRGKRIQFRTISHLKTPTLLVCAGHVRKIIVMHQIIAASIGQVGLAVAHQLLASIVKLNKTEVQSVLGFEQGLLSKERVQLGRFRLAYIGSGFLS